MRKNKYAVVLLLCLSTTITSCAQEKHEYVDLGLPSGTLWARCNIGAKTPEEYGDYFAWGETEPKKRYSPETYKFFNIRLDEYGEIDEDKIRVTKYNLCKEYGNVDGKTILDSEDDAARVRWGVKWQIPSKKECEELLKVCEWKWKDLDDEHGGYMVIGPNGNSIFLPAAGGRDDLEEVDPIGAGEVGAYWSSSLYDDSDDIEKKTARGTAMWFFSSGEIDLQRIVFRFCGCSVRPVYHP